MKSDGYDAAHPILVADTKLGYIVLDGYHRGNAAAKAGIKSIPANVVSNEDYRALLDAKFAGVRPASLSDLDPYIYVDGVPYSEIRDDNDHDNTSQKIVAAQPATSAASSARIVATN